MEHLFHPLSVWIRHNPEWALLATFLTTFIESCAIIGMVVPSTITLTAIGMLIGAGTVPTVPIFIAAISGGILGDLLSFWIGYRYHNKIRNVWPINRFPKLIIKGEQFFQKHGGKGIFLSRFIGVMRPLMPLIAGIMRVKPKKFLIIESISGTLWAPIYMIPGIIAGAAAAHFAPAQAVRYGIILLIIIAAFWLCYWLTRLMIRLAVTRWNGRFDQYWLRLKQSNSLIFRLLYEHENPVTSRPLTIFTFFTLFLLLTICLLLNVITEAHWLIAVNISINHFFQTLTNTHLISAAILISALLGRYTVILVTACVVSVYLALRKDWHAIYYLLLSLVVAVIAIAILKHTILVLRPNVVISPPQSSSLPSGHVLISMTFYGFIAFLVAHNNKIWIKKTAYSLAAIATVLVALSRLYLNIHWLSDIVCSILIASCILMIMVLFYRCRERTKYYFSRHLLIIIILSQSIIGTWQYLRNAKVLNHNFQLKPISGHINNEMWWRNESSMLPIYRHNRLGHRNQIINLQWQGDFNDIKSYLKSKGWQSAQRFGIKAITAQLMGKDITIISPLPQTYRNELPVLVMVKHQSVKGTYLVLRLWRSGYASSGLPIFVGTIDYHLPLKHILWHKPTDCEQLFQSPLVMLEQDLTRQQIKILKNKPTLRLPHNICVAVDNRIIKVKD